MGNQFYRITAELLELRGLDFLEGTNSEEQHFNFKKTQILCHLLDLIAFRMIQEYFSKSIQISKKLKKGDPGPNFWGGTSSADSLLNYLVPPSVFQF